MKMLKLEETFGAYTRTRHVRLQFANISLISLHYSELGSVEEDV